MSTRAGTESRAITLAGATGMFVLLGWTAVVPWLPSLGVVPSRAIWLAVAPVVALLALACFGTGTLRPAVWWCALALGGQLVALQLIEAGTAMRYQHYPSIPRLVAETHPLLLLYLALQTGLVAGALARRWMVIRTWLQGAFRPWQLVGIALVFVLSSATVSPDPLRYVLELVTASLIQAVNVGNIVLIAWAVPGSVLVTWGARFRAVLGESRRGRDGVRHGVDWFTLGAATFVTVTTGLLAFFVYERHPHIPDEVAYLYHARLVASGMLTTQAPSVPDAFEFYLMQVKDSFWYPVTLPGWPAVLALGVLCGVPWLVNPVLAGLNVLLASALLQRLYDRPTARMGIFLLCVSPWHVFMAMNLMTHTLNLTCALVGAVSVLRARTTGRHAWAFLAGAAAGVASLVRPLDGMIIAALLGLWVVSLGHLRRRALALTALVVGCIGVGALALPYNAALTGNATLLPIMQYTDERFGKNSNAYGFGADRGMAWPIDPFVGHGPTDALVNASLNTFSLNVELFGWSTGSLLLATLLVFSRSLRRSDYLMLATVAVTFVAYFFYYFSGGPDFGARYWFLMLVPCVALTVRAIRHVGALLESATNEGVSTARITVAVLALCLSALANYFPWRAVDKYHGYLGMRPELAGLARDRAFGRSLVLIRGQAHPDYASAAIHNPLDLTADVPVYVWDRTPSTTARVLAAFPDRPVWLLNGPSVTGSGFMVVGGPLSGHDVLDGRRDPR